MLPHFLCRGAESDGVQEEQSPHAPAASTPRSGQSLYYQVHYLGNLVWFSDNSTHGFDSSVSPNTMVCKKNKKKTCYKSMYYCGFGNFVYLSVYLV